MVDVLIAFGIIWFLYWGNTKPIKNRLAQIRGHGPANDEIRYLNSRIARLFATAVAASVGAFFGSFIGIAGLGSAIAGTIPCALVGALIGWLAGAKSN